MKKITSVFLGITTALWLSGAAMIVPTVAHADTMSDLQIQISALLTQIATLQSQIDAVQGNTTDTTVCGYTFSSNLSKGDSNADVKNLQNALNSDPSTAVAISGVGSTGNETNYFGSLTENAVIKFQNKYASEVLTPIGLTTGTGYVGSMTRAKLNTLYGTCIVPEEPIIEEPVIEPTIINRAVISSDNTQSTYVTKNASNFKMLEVNFEGNGTINNLTVEKIGFSTISDYNGGIYLYKDGARLTNKRSFSSNDNTATFNNLNLQAPFTLSVMADFDGNVGNVAQVRLDGNYEGLPMQSNGFTFSGIESGTISIENNGSLTDPVVGQENAQISEFKIINGNATSSVTVTHIELYNGGHNILSNVTLTDGDNTWNGQLSNGKVIFDINSNIRADRSETFEVYADIDGNEGDDIELYIRNTYDVKAIDTDFGFGVTVDISEFDEESDSHQLSLIENGELTVKSKSTDDVIGYWGQTVDKVAKFRFEADDSEGFYIEELSFLASTTLMNGAEKIIITYENEDGDTVTKSESTDEDNLITFDSFSSSDRPFVGKDSRMDILVGLELRNDDDSIRLVDYKVTLDGYIATGKSSNEEVEETDLDKESINGVWSNASIVMLSENGTITLDPLDDIEFSLSFNSDDRISAFASTTGFVRLGFNHSTTSETSLVGDLKAKVYANDILVKTITLKTGELKNVNVRLTTEEEGTLELSDGDNVDIRIEFTGDDAVYFSSDDGDKLSVAIADTNNQIKWIDNYEGDDETFIVKGNIKDMTSGLPLKFIYKD